MSRIILIETSTSLCSTALVEEGSIVSARVSEKARSQAALTAPFVKEMLDERGLRVQDCDAVCVSSGPGSYTGLRVGVSTAKGLCFGAKLPLIAVDTLETLVWQAIDGNLIPEGCTTVIPMIDARRMEVYTAVYSVEGGNVKRLSDITPVIVEKGCFAKELSEGPVLFIGDGARKCAPVLGEKNATYIQACPEAASMLHPAVEKFEAGKFEDMAYFEPFYLKQFVATVSKKNLF